MFRDILSGGTRVLLPYFIIFLLNFFLIYSVYESKKKVQARMSKKDRNFTVSIMSMNIFYCFNAVLITMCAIMTNFNSDNIYYSGVLSLVSVFATYWNLINHSFSILINLKYNKLFRKQFNEIVSKIFKLFITLINLDQSKKISNSG